MFKLLSKNSHWIILCFLLLLNFSPVLAANPAYEDCGKDFCLNVPIGADTAGFDMGSNILGNYVRAWYGFLLGTVGIMATVMIMWGGFKYLTSRGDKSQITTAKAQIISALTGVVLAFSSYTLLSIINPALLVITMPNLPELKGGENVDLAAVGPQEATANHPSTVGSGRPPNLNLNSNFSNTRNNLEQDAIARGATIPRINSGVRPNDNGSLHQLARAVDYARNPSNLTSFDNYMQELFNSGTYAYPLSRTDPTPVHYVTLPDGSTGRLINEGNHWHFDNGQPGEVLPNGKVI